MCAGGSQSSSSWFCLLLEITQGEHPLALGAGKGPWCHCRQIAAGSHRCLLRQVDANFAGLPTLLLPPYIPRAAMVPGPSTALERSQCSHKPLCSSALPESCSLWGHLTAYGISQAIPQAWNQMGPCDCRAHAPAVTSSPPQCWGWPCSGATGLGHTSQALHAAELAGGSCLGLVGCFRALC